MEDMTITIPIKEFKELIEKSARMDIFVNMILSDHIYSKDMLLDVLDFSFSKSQSNDLP